MSQSTSPKGGIGFVGALTILFIALKLLEVINWSWWVVLLPVEIPAVFIFLCVAIAVIKISADDMRKRNK